MRDYADVSLLLGAESMVFGKTPKIMGIVNVTPDSFSDGGEFLTAEAAVEHAHSLVAAGADWLDIGGESTRPGAAPVDETEELRRVEPVLRRLAAEAKVPISIDTYKPAVARRAMECGARIINDVTGFRDPKMIEVAAGTQATCVCMHMKGTPATMRDLADYADLIPEMLAYFEQRLEVMQAGGIARERILLDPGIGFAKKLRHNVEILARLAELRKLGRPVLLGASRKRIIGELTGRPEPDRLAGTIGSAVVGYLNGADVLRVHDVAAVRDALAVATAIASFEPDDKNRNVTKK
jgi:dihydropteroate synthase